MPLLIIQLAFLVAVAFVVGCVLGRLLRRRKKNMTDTERTIVAAALSTPAAADETAEPVGNVASPEKPSPPREAEASDELVAQPRPVPDAEVVGGDLPAKAAEPEVAIEPKDVGRPASLDAPREGKADDLTVISGIGRAVEGMLNGLGVFHYDQIASWTAPEAAWIERAIGFPRRIERERWLEQAAKLARAAVKPTASRRGAKTGAAPARSKPKPVKKAES